MRLFVASRITIYTVFRNRNSEFAKAEFSLYNFAVRQQFEEYDEWIRAMVFYKKSLAAT